MITRTFYRQYSVFKVQTSYEASLCQRAFGDLIIIFLTSRTDEYKERTLEFLKNNGVRYDHIIFNAPYGERVLVNDRKPSGLDMSVGINLDRDDGITFQVEEDKNL
ncbi:MAG: hypothetical protein MSA84_00425 [Lachnospiraceae bacterium]|nr:hypothetical protein [Lachnospiraceae bacterium]